MKYLSREELDKIYNNPTVETLENICKKYKEEKNEFIEKSIISEEKNTTEVQSVIPRIHIPPVEEKKIENTVSNTIPITNINEQLPPAAEIFAPPSDNQNNLGNNLNNSMDIGVPTLNKVDFTVPNQNNDILNFNGNIFEPQMPNLMETTDNFNANLNNNMNFNTNTNTQSETSMFGQIQQDYNGAA